MRELLVTSFSPEGEQNYGRQMVASALEHWPSPMVVYTDTVSDLPTHTRLTGDIPQWTETQALLPSTSDDPDRYKAKGYLWNAKQFAVKCFVWCDAAERLGEGLLTWLDGDTRIIKAVPAHKPAEWLGDADVAFLGRGVMHPETGYVAFRIPEALPLLRWCRDAYITGTFREIETGWTDCHVLRKGLTLVKPRARLRNLTADVWTGRAWHSRIDAVKLSPLGRYVTHLKGKERKRVAAC